MNEDQGRGQKNDTKEMMFSYIQMYETFLWGF